MNRFPFNIFILIIFLLNFVTHSKLYAQSCKEILTNEKTVDYSIIDIKQAQTLDEMISFLESKTVEYHKTVNDKLTPLLVSNKLEQIKTELLNLSKKLISLKIEIYTEIEKSLDVNPTEITARILDKNINLLAESLKSLSEKINQTSSNKDIRIVLEEIILNRRMPMVFAILHTLSERELFSRHDIFEYNQSTVQFYSNHKHLFFFKKCKKKDTLSSKFLFKSARHNNINVKPNYY